MYKDRDYNSDPKLEILCKSIFKKDIGNLAKLYNNKNEYIDEKNSFIRKFRIFENNYQYINIQIENYPKVFIIILLGLAFDLHYNNLHDKLQILQ